MNGRRPPLETSLQGKTIALPESRQLDVLSALFERRGAIVSRTPLVSILDAPDPAPVHHWLTEFCRKPPAYFIILTGEGLTRLRHAAEQLRLLPQFVDALHKTCNISRGPKPERVLKQLGVAADLFGETPTSSGIIKTLQGLDLKDTRVAVQLYGDDPNALLMDYLATRDIAECLVVSPYVYASDADAEQVKALIRKLGGGEIDVIAFTSQPQVRRLLDVASKHGLEHELAIGMARTKIAAVGPVVAEVLRKNHFTVDVMPASAFFMKPLVRAVESLFDRRNLC